ncbi:hypothetical protein [Sphingomonas glacialis]|uniref:hypothetical protein n=1 Tax=Sphingomonas glacialis TaxID=658225 RepID=UPI001F4F3CA3|nr:hypothetical protein [Sphingomonas glacialis]
MENGIVPYPAPDQPPSAAEPCRERSHDLTEIAGFRNVAVLQQLPKQTDRDAPMHIKFVANLFLERHGRVRNDLRDNDRDGIGERGLERCCAQPDHAANGFNGPNILYPETFGRTGRLSDRTRRVTAGALFHQGAMIDELDEVSRDAGLHQRSRHGERGKRRLGTKRTGRTRAEQRRPNDPVRIGTRERRK